MVHSDSVNESTDHQKDHGQPNDTRGHAHPLTAKVSGGAPDKFVPVALRKEKKRQNADCDDEPQYKKSPIHSNPAFSTSVDCSTLILSALLHLRTVFQE